MNSNRNDKTLAGVLAENADTLKAFEGLPAEAVEDLASALTRVEVPEGGVLIRQGDTAEAMYIVEKGLLRAAIARKGSAPAAVGLMGPGSLIGEIALLTGSRRNATVTAVEPSRLARLEAAELKEIMDRHPGLKRGFLEIARRRLRRSRWLKILSDYFGEIDEENCSFIESCFSWVHLDRGRTLFSEGDESDGLYILVHGFLHITAREPSGAVRVVGSVYRGEIVGEMAILSGEKRTATVSAVRDCDLVRLTKDDFLEINKAYPEFSLTIMRTLVKRLQESGRTGGREHGLNIALLAASPRTPLAEFAHRLYSALIPLGKTVLLNSRVLGAEFSTAADMAQTPDHDPRHVDLVAWLEDREAGHDFILYEADAELTPWTKRCLKQADQVLIVARAGDDPAPGSIEGEGLRLTEGFAATPQTLILIHPDGRTPPSDTQAWLTPRRLAGHHHLRWNKEADFERLARLVSRRAVGLVLGGGGARGMAHLGVIRALEERGIPIDLVAGTSIGAIVGGAYARGADADRLMFLCRETFEKNNPFSDVTVPVVSLLRSRKIERAARRVYGETRIEDLWTGFFCISCNLGSCDVNIHRNGPLWKAVRTSSSLPGIMVPVIHGGKVHVDGGVMNNLPGDIMRREAGIVITVDVDARENMTAGFPEYPSPWKILWSRIWPWANPVPVPTVAEIMMATIMTGCRKCADAVKEGADLSLEPPVGGIGILDFKAIARTAKEAYDYTQDMIDRLSETSPLRPFLRPKS
ncbi:MAG: cyclic nucleotide-binding domain-containing protein [Candidatus Aminicenantes bacterium]|nr:cyclic nucleotide-binding domain-containing protein [Candidatus Aminicenantes bacterium]